MPSNEFINRPGSIWERYKFDGKPMPVIREEMERELLGSYTAPEGVHWKTGTCGGIDGKWVYPANDENTGNFLYYIHGGGFTLGSSGIPLPFLCELSHRLNIPCFSVDYRLAPEHPFPVGLEDCIAAYEGLLEKGYSPEKMIVSGESAGGTLSLALIHHLKAAGKPVPKAVVSISPVVNAVPGHSAADSWQHFPVLEKSWKCTLLALI